MSILAWIVLGIVAGFIASKLINKTGSGLIMDLVLGVVGAVVGGWLFAQFGSAGGDRVQSLQPVRRRGRGGGSAVDLPPGVPARARLTPRA